MSFVLRLVDDALARGEVVGSVESVETGDRAIVHDLDELAAFLSLRRLPDEAARGVMDARGGTDRDPSHDTSDEGPGSVAGRDDSREAAVASVRPSVGGDGRNAPS